MKSWTGPEIATLAGVDYRTFHNWVGRGIVRPSIREANGSGRPAIFSDDDLLIAVILGAARPLVSIEGLRILARAALGENP